jgi:hypothetical protein
MKTYIYRGRRPIRDFRLVRQDVEPVAVQPVPPPAIPEYSAMFKADLIALAGSLGINATGTRAEIIARLPHG